MKEGKKGTVGRGKEKEARGNGELNQKKKWKQMK